MPHVEWRKLRADQLRELAKQNAIVIVPVASMEQHGPHLPVEVDTVLGEEIAARTARKIVAAGQAAVTLPALWTGISEHHMSFGGTISLEAAELSALMGGVVRSIVRHGFKRIAILNSHGGNENALRAIVDDFTPRFGLPIVQFTYWYPAAPAIAKILETQGGLTHACEAETSMMMAARPDLVATDRIPRGRSNVSHEVGGGIYRWRDIGSRSETGAMGNPEAATAEKGERLFEAVSDTLATKLADADLWSARWRTEPMR